MAASKAYNAPPSVAEAKPVASVTSAKLIVLLAPAVLALLAGALEELELLLEPTALVALPDFELDELQAAATSVNNSATNTALLRPPCRIIYPLPILNRLGAVIISP
jgi:hypothetical protein